MNQDEDKLEKIISRLIGEGFQLKTSSTEDEIFKQSSTPMNKEDFIGLIKTLQDLVRKSDTLAEKFGIDLIGIEGGYLDVISTLMRSQFNSAQLALIDFHIYESETIPSWDGIYELHRHKYKIGTPEHLWDSINQLSNK